MAKKPAAQPSPAKPSPPKTSQPAAAARSPAVRPAAPAVSSASTPSTKAQTTSLSPRSSPQEIAIHVWNRYLQDTPSRTLLLDVFMLFLVLVGGVQFLYCVLAGNYPFNAFLSGFSAAVGQFVLTASLRMQTSERPPAGASAAAKKGTSKSIDSVTGELVEEGKSSKISSERAFADFVFGSLILHGFCVNFIN